MTTSSTCFETLKWVRGHLPTKVQRPWDAIPKGGEGGEQGLNATGHGGLFLRGIKFPDNLKIK